MTEVVAQSRAITELFADAAMGGRRQTFEAGQAILGLESPSTDVWFVNKGQVRVYQPGPDGSQRLISILGAEQMFNCVALSGEPACGFRAVAATQTVATSVPAARLMAALATRPDAATELVRQMAQRLLASYDAAAQLVFNDCHSRLITTLCQLSTSACATAIPDGGVMLRI
ncbi:MAG TPA: Crp/Fnr family transcriptional regulator, partial [Tepidisphaeraceae bacterium]|nr:Crp/Fnr family transcriptional regulator [Tepidisphaeraceae bacterium]